MEIWLISKAPPNRMSSSSFNRFEKFTCFRLSCNHHFVLLPFVLQSSCNRHALWKKQNDIFLNVDPRYSSYARRVKYLFTYSFKIYLALD